MIDGFDLDRLESMFLSYEVLKSITDRAVRDGSITDTNWLILPPIRVEYKKMSEIGWGWTGNGWVCRPNTLLYRPDKGILAEESLETTL